MMPEIILKNGVFRTGNRLAPYAGHVICANGRIAAAETRTDTQEDAGTELDLGGRFAMPGFIDAHTHFRIGGAMLNRIDLRAVRSEQEFSDAVRKHAKAHPAGKRNQPWDRRLRIEHAQHLREKDFRRFSGMSVIASVQPYHCIDDGRWAAKKIGNDRARLAFPFKRFLDEGINLLTAVGGKVIYSDGTIYNAELHGNSAA